MRKLLAILLAALLTISLVACDTNEDPQSSSAPESSESSLPESSELEDPSEPESSEPEDPSEPESSEPEEPSEPESSEPDEPSESETPTTTSTSVRITTTTIRTITTTRKITTTTTTESVEPTTTTTTEKDDPPTPPTTGDWELPTTGDWEKPVTINTAVLYNKKSSSYDSKAETMRKGILGTKDTLKATNGGKTYYISYRGNDENDGLSAQTPWLTADNLSETAFNNGDVVLFERGGVYRNMEITMKYGVSYGAYGDSSKPKPQLYGGDKSYADESLWKQTSTAHVWRAKVPNGTKDIGNIIFDHGKICASDGKVLSTKKLKKDYDFYHDTKNNYVYLYLSKGNPAKLHQNIEICPRIIAFSGVFTQNITIENLCIKYYFYGISASGGAKNITVRGCEIGYIGGSMLDSRVRAGNGIEFFGKCDDMLVEDCWIYQCFDAGYSNQGDNCYQQNITIRDNLIEYCPYNIEIWTTKEIGKGGMADSVIENNVLRFAGYGFGTNNRFASSTVAVGNISMYDYVVPCENVVIKNNVFDSSYRYVISIAYPNDSQGRGPTITNNTWIQQPFDKDDNPTTIIATATEDGIVPCVGQTNKVYQCGSLNEMKESVKVFDKNPTKILLEN